MPITKPSGTINPTVSAAFSAHGSQTREESSDDITMASSAVSSAIKPRALMRRPSSLRPMAQAPRS